VTTAVAVALLLLLGGAFVVEALRPAPAEIDEPAWVTTSLLTLDLARAGASPAQWGDAYAEAELGDWGNKNPPVGKLLFGMAIAPFVQPGDIVAYRWDWHRSVRANRASQTMPPPHLLRPGRVAAAASAFLVLLFVLGLGWRLTGSLSWAIVAPITLALTPAFQFHAVRIYMDGPLLALLAATVLAALGRCWAVRLLALILGGLACATKFSAGVVVLGIGFHMLSEARSRRWLWLAAVLTIPTVTFVSVNPWLHPAPIERTLELMVDWDGSKARQKEDPLLAADAIAGPMQGLATVVFRGVLQPHSNRHTSSLTSAHLRARLGALASGLVVFSLAMATLGWRVGGCLPPAAWMIFAIGTAGDMLLWQMIGRPPLPGVSGLALVGIATLVSKARSEHSAPVHGFAIVWLTVLVGTGLWLPFDWPRYHLPVIVLSAPILAVGLQSMGAGLRVRRGRPWVPDSMAVVSLLCWGAAASAVAWTAFLLAQALLLPMLWNPGLTG